MSGIVLSGDTSGTVALNAPTVAGTQSYTLPTAVPAPTGTFTPYADLTQEQVLGWIWANGVDQTATEAAVQSQINNQINPPVLNLNPPWSV
jgi:hypothetical protein